MPSAECRPGHLERPPPPSVDEGGTARVDGLDLGHVDGAALEAGRQLAAVEEDAARGGDGAEVAAGHAADTDLADGLLERAELLRVVAVRREGRVLGAPRGVAVAEALREGARGRGGVGLGRVVDVGCLRVRMWPSRGWGGSGWTYWAWFAGRGSGS